MLGIISYLGKCKLEPLWEALHWGEGGRETVIPSACQDAEQIGFLYTAGENEN